MSRENHRLHIFFLPYPGHGHIIPNVDMARLFAVRGTRATIVTTPLNLPLVSTIIGKSNSPANSSIDIVAVKFPSVEAGSPEGCEHIVFLSLCAFAFFKLHSQSELTSSTSYSRRRSRISLETFDGSSKIAFMFLACRERPLDFLWETFFEVH